MTKVKSIRNISKQEIAFYVREFYDRNNKPPRIMDVCSLPFSKLRVVKLFGTWSDMLRYCQLPLNRNPPRLMECATCSKKFEKQLKEIRKCVNHFCSSACNAIFYSTGRPHTEETKRKISESLKAHRIFT
jgi:hypothetical protein